MLVTSKNAKPPSFKGIKKQSVSYLSNRKAGIRLEIFEEELPKLE